MHERDVWSSIGLRDHLRGLEIVSMDPKYEGEISGTGLGARHRAAAGNTCEKKTGRTWVGGWDGRSGG